MRNLKTGVVAHSKTMALRNAMIAELVSLGFKEDKDWNDRHRSDKGFQFIFVGREGLIAIHNHNCSSSTPHLYELPAQWDAFLAQVESLTVVEPKYKVGDYVTVINDKANSGNAIGKTYKITDTRIGGVGRFHGVRIYNLATSDFGYWETAASIRPATKQEAAEARVFDIRLGGYQMKSDKKNQIISFGCQTFSKEHIDGFFQLVNGPAKARITIAGETVTVEMLTKMRMSLI